MNNCKCTYSNIDNIDVDSWHGNDSQANVSIVGDTVRELLLCVGRCRAKGDVGSVVQSDG